MICDCCLQTAVLFFVLFHLLLYCPLTVILAFVVELFIVVFLFRVVLIFMIVTLFREYLLFLLSRLTSLVYA
jgi:hypothetical protein